MAGTDCTAFNKRLRDLTDDAIRESLAEISAEFQRRFSTPLVVEEGRREAVRSSLEIAVVAGSISREQADVLERSINGAVLALTEGLGNYTLPCDVHIPPATVIAAGCDLATLKLAMEWEGRPRKFEGNPNYTLPRFSLPATDDVIPGPNLRMLQLVRNLANAEYRSEVDRCIDEANAILATLTKGARDAG